MNFNSLFKYGPMILSIVGGILVILGASWATIRQSQTEEKLHDQLNKNVELTEKNHNFIIGEGSYCYLLLSPNAAVPNSISEFLFVVGENPLWDVQMELTDIDELNRINLDLLPIQKRYNELKKTKISYNFGNLRSSSGIDLGRFNISEEKESIYYYCRFSARNGFWEEIIKIKKIGDNIETAYKVYMDEKILKEYVSNNFPRNENGEIDW